MFYVGSPVLRGKPSFLQLGILKLDEFETPNKTLG